MEKKTLAAVGFEPTPPKRLVPKTSALDRSATLPICRKVAQYKTISVMKSNPQFPFLFNRYSLKYSFRLNLYLISSSLGILFPSSYAIKGQNSRQVAIIPLRHRVPLLTHTHAQLAHA